VNPVEVDRAAFARVVLEKLAWLLATLAAQG